MDGHLESIVALTRDLIRIPTRAGVDPVEPALDVVAAWLTARGVHVEPLRGDGGAAVGVVARIPLGATGPSLVLNATIDTAPFGDAKTWTGAPTSGECLDGWLHGRGAADSKVGVALFAQLGVTLASAAADLAGELILLFDAGEHDGTFAGARAFFEEQRPDNLLGVLIGYPGHEHLVVGSRGFWRARLCVHGRAAHSGSSSERGQNAIEKAVRLVEGLRSAGRRAELEADDGFLLPPKVTVTRIEGGESFTIVPDRCQVSIDVRLTPSFDSEHAHQMLTKVVQETDREVATDRNTTVNVMPGWPAFQLQEGSRVLQAMREASMEVLGSSLRERVVGPSNIGNYLASLGVDATAGYGVRYRNLHGTDEAFEVASIRPAYSVYQHAVQSMLARR